MLVLSRRLNEKVLFPNLGISVEVLKVNKDRVRLGIEAPESIQVLRSEIAPQAALPSPDGPVFEPVQLLTNFRLQLKMMIDKLYEVHDTLLENKNPDDAEATLYKLFIELQAMDEMVAKCMEMGLSSPLNPPTKRRALIVEDNLNEARLLAGFLKVRNFEVDIAGNGKVAMDYLDSHDPPDCMLLDMAMPQFDGEWTLRAIRNRPEFNNMNIYVMSGAEPSDFELQLGPQLRDHWFRKPLDPDLLVRQIERENCGQTGQMSV